MLRGSRTPLKIKENESGCPEEKEEASFPLSKDQKICRVPKPKLIRASKENFSGGKQTRPQKRALKSPRGPEEGLGHPQGVDVSWQLPGGSFGVLRGDVVGEPPLPLDTKENFSSRQPFLLGHDFYSTSERDRAEEKPDFGISEELGKKPGDFAAVTIAEFGVAQKSFTKRPTGTSPTSLKFRRRSTIGLRGSPENNTLIRYLAQQRSSRQKEGFTQISPFKHANVRSLKDKIDAFQSSFESLQEAEGESGLPGLSHLADASQEGSTQEGGSSQNKAPFKKEPNLEQWSEKFMLGNRGAGLKENLSPNGTKSSKCETRICSILSPHRAVTVTDPAAAKEWLNEQENPMKSLETVVSGDILETDHVHRCDHSTGGTGSEALSDLSTKKGGFVEDLSLGMFDGSKAPVTPPRTGNIPINELTQSGSLLRSILKKTPVKQPMDIPEEYPNDAVGRGGGESAAVSNCVKAFETFQTDTTESHNSKTPKKKKVTFGEVLSPEIFDETLPANTPLRRGASPACPQLLQSPWARPGLPEEPLPRLDFGGEDECVEPLQEVLEGSVAAEAPSPVENTEVAETDKPDMVTTRSSTKRKSTAVSEESDCSTSGAPNTKSDQDTKNPRKNKIQRQKNPTSSAPRKSQKTKHTGYGKRRKKKVKKSLYGEREMASKKPLLSPIPEIPEVFSSVSSPGSPKADALFTEGAGLGNPKSRNACKDIPQEEAEAGRMGGELLCAAAACPSPGELPVAAASSSRIGNSGLSGSLEAAPGTDPKFSSIGTDAEGGVDTSEYFQQGKETASEKEAKESCSLREKEELQGNLLSGLEILEQQNVQEGAQRTQCPQKDSVRGGPARRRRRSSSAICLAPVGNWEISGMDLPVSYNVEEVLCVPEAQEGSLQPCRRKSSSGEVRVRRSMRLSRDAASEGLAWIQLPSEIPLPAPAPKARRRSSTSILAGSENIHPREPNLIPFPAPGKENEGSAPAAAGPGRRWRRRSLCEAKPRETPWAQTQRRRRTSSGYGKDRNNQSHPGEAETLELRLNEVPALSDFVK